MPFRFNHKDLSVLAVQSADLFDKEGILWFKEKEGKLLNKRENFSERLCRLKGNLLFYFKGKEKSSECTGVIILERFKVVSDSSFKKYGFIIEFDEPEEQKYEFAASSKEDYIEWIEKFNSASYEKLQKKLQDLRNEIVNITGQDPLPDYHPVIQVIDSGGVSNTNRPVSLFSPHFPDTTSDDVMMEMCIACSALQNESDSPPCAMIKVYTVCPPETDWNKHSQTEISEESYEPNFLRTIVFTNEYDEYTRLRFVVYDVLSKAKSDTVTIGQTVCTIQEIQQAPNWQLSLSIICLNLPYGFCGLVALCIYEVLRKLCSGGSSLRQSIAKRESTGRFKEVSMYTTPFYETDGRQDSGILDVMARDCPQNPLKFASQSASFSPQMKCYCAYKVCTEMKIDRN